MPELPEVESLRRSLIPVLTGRTIKSVKVYRPKLVSSAGTVRKENPVKVAEFERELSGQTFKTAERIAKNLIFTFESGKAMLVHLKMTGQLVYTDGKNTTLGGHPIQVSETELPNKHSHIHFELDKGWLYFNDVRMFGYVLYFPDRESLMQENALQNVGMDPMTEDFTFEPFYKPLKKKKKVLKTALLEQSIVTGLGNIYVDEVCFRAGVRPTRRTDTVTKKEYEKLFEAIKYIIPRAVEQGGSSVANYIMADGSRGTYAREHKVYNRGGKPCLVCGTTLKSLKINGRTTVYCPSCQS